MLNPEVGAVYLNDLAASGSVVVATELYPYNLSQKWSDALSIESFGFF